MVRWFASTVAGQTCDAPAPARSGQPDRPAEGASRRHGRHRFGATFRRRVEPTNRIARALVILAPGVLAAVASLSMSASTAAGEPARFAIRAAPHPGYGRLVFDWPGPVEFERTDVDGAVVVRFGRPFAGDLSAVPERLGDYLRDIERTEDGRGVRLRLPAGVRARLSHFDPDLVVVDLERNRVTAADDAGVAIRTGEHDGFTRIVFDWPGPVTFREHRDGRDLPWNSTARRRSMSWP